jgi:vitamin B12 transporter
MTTRALPPTPRRALVSFVGSLPACALASILTAAAVAQAQGSATPRAGVLDPVVVTAARTAQPIAEVLADVTVISGEEIRRSGVQSLTELLQRQPGVEIIQNGGPGSVSGALLRGANRGQTLVLVDGLRVGSSSAG